MRTVMGDLMNKKSVRNIDLARKLGISEVVISAWKTRRAYVPPHHRSKLACTLGVDVEDILDELGMAKVADEEEL